MSTLLWRPDHPRIRGEHPRIPSPATTKWGSSPHTRGAQSAPGHRQRQRGIIPAYAGSTKSPRKARGWQPDHPRIRGEHQVGVDLLKVLPGSSPHTRGALGPDGHGLSGVGIIPAYAGSTTWIFSGTARGAGSSPHTRGALETLGLAENVMGIIPAYAGSTKAA